MRNESSWRRTGTVWSTGVSVAVAVAFFMPLAADASITGVCPDGSIFIVQSAGSIPCRGAKAVDPSDVPPLKPEFLPRPYGWEIFNRRNDPNNPYNLIRSAPIDDPVAVRQQQQRQRQQHQQRQQQQHQHQQMQPNERVEIRREFVTESRPPVSAPATQTASASTAPIGLGSGEIRDLVTIVDLSQRRAPAALTARDSGGRVQLAMSSAFESRLLQRFAADGRSTGGNVVLFSADTQEAGSFYGNLTFVQGHIAYQPDSSDPLQLGVVLGSLGKLGVDEPVLGYVVLPERMDLSQPVDIYWNDLQITATLRP